LGRRLIAASRLFMGLDTQLIDDEKHQCAEPGTVMPAPAGVTNGGKDRAAG
jgi:hypothetical protein